VQSTIAAQGPAAAMRGIGYVMLAFAPIVYLCLSYGRVQLPMPKVAADSQPLAQVRYQRGRLRFKCRFNNRTTRQPK